MSATTTATYNQMQKYCDDASGRDFNPKFRNALKSVFAKYADEIVTVQKIGAWQELDIEVEGQMCVLSHCPAHGQYHPELWSCRRKINAQMSADKAASQQARLARMFNNAK